MALISGLVILLFSISCTSGSEYDVRNKEIFDEAQTLAKTEFTTDQPTFSGATSISALITTSISNPPLTPGARTESTLPNKDTIIADTTIEGIVTIPGSYGFALGNGGCNTNDVYQRSFVLQDSTGGILVAYGLEPPIQDTTQAGSMKYITNARRPNMGVLGDRLRLTVTRVLLYGTGTTATTIPVVTDFKDVVVVSTNNRVPYAVQTAQLARSDLYRMRQVEGYVKTRPSHVECANATGRQFQFNYQRGYIGVICLNATSATDAQTCTGAKIPIKFQMSLYLGAGTLSGFDVGDMFSYNIAQGAKVRLRGVVFPPEYAAADTSGDETLGNLSLMLGQRVQVETLK